MFAPMTLLLSACLAGQAVPADLVLRGGKLVTVDDQKPVAEAAAIAGDRLMAIGTTAEMAPFIGPKTKVIELAGKLVVPGLIEGHGHFSGVGEARMILNLADCARWEEVVAKVAAAAAKAPKGKWIHGRGWHQGKWDVPPQPNVEGYPVHRALSDVSPNNPVLLVHGTGHMSFANAKAMELAGIAATTAAPNGGIILRDAAGQATGVFRETAQALFSAAVAEARRQMSPLEKEQEARRQIELANEECLMKGITSFQDAGSPLSEIDLFQRAADEGKLGVRLWVMTNDSNRALAARLAKYRTIDYARGHLTVRAIKRMIDGALGTHGAWLLEPYDDLPESRGLNLNSLDYLAETAKLALEHDVQLCVHAIGDRANRETLDLFERAAPRPGDLAALRWRIEHVQHLHPQDLPRFGKLGVIASMQANHCTSDGPFVVARLGERRAREGAYAWQALLKSGARIVNGTDAPVENVDPLLCFHAAVTRQMKDGRTFFPEQCFTREQALRSYTLDAAYAAFEEETKGSLSVGKLADMVVLSQDIMTVPAEAIPKTRVLATIVGGQVLYEAK